MDLDQPCGRGPLDPLPRMDDGCDDIRRILRMFMELERFERD